MSDILNHIQAYKREEIAFAKSTRPVVELAAAARDVSAPRGFLQALEARRCAGQLALIAEVKKGSPSGGLIRPQFEPTLIARAYESGGATCISVVTDGPSFMGSLHYLAMARDATSLPVLRKDFFFDPYQVIEARAWGADCILVILAALSDDDVRRLVDTAADCGMDALLEVHDMAELDRALCIDSRFVGINNRDLRTLEVDLGTTLKLARNVPAQTHLVSESGIFTNADIRTLESQAGVKTFLVGESLMRKVNVEAATRTLLEG